MSDKKYGGILQNWYVDIDDRISGYLYNDPNKRFPEGERVLTSVAVEMDVGATYVETQNTIYDLGEPYVNKA